MLIPLEQIYDLLIKNNIKINGVLHIGAHDCEELPFYNILGIKTENIIWIEAIEQKVIECQNKGIHNVFQAVITDKDDEYVSFNIANNIQSSSILEFGTHLIEHPHIYFINKKQLKTITIDTFFQINNVDACKCDFWNFDIQGAELQALTGAIKNIQYAKIIYLEINEKELYKNCALVNEIDIFLLQYGFKRTITCMTEHGWGDAIYIK